MMNWILCATAIILWVTCLYLHNSRNRYRESAKTLAKEVVSLRADYARVSALLPVPLTQTKPRAQYSPKRFSGPQLRRMAEKVNNADWEGLQERPNSEIL